MDWDFLNIFKKAEFNTLMLSVSITGWILYFCISTNIYILGTAILSSAYCIIRLVVYTYQYYSLKRENRRYEIQKKKEEEEKEKRYENNKNIEITRMFEGLSDSNKFILASILLKGQEDKFNSNIFHFDKYSNEASTIYMAESISAIYRDRLGVGQPSIKIKDYTDTVSVTVEPYLYDLLKQYIEKNKNQ